MSFAVFFAVATGVVRVITLSIVSFSNTSLQLTHSLCLLPVSVAVGFLSIIQSLNLCPFAGVSAPSDFLPQTVHTKSPE